MNVYKIAPHTGMYLGSVDSPEGVIPPNTTATPLPAGYRPGDVYIWTGAWVKKADGIAPASPYAPVPRPRLVLTAIGADAAHADAISVTAALDDVTCPAGTLLAVAAELQDADGAPVPVTATFRMPIVARDGREKVLLVSLVDGVASFNAPMRESGVWEVTAAIINQGLPATEQMDFGGITIYVVEAE